VLFKLNEEKNTVTGIKTKYKEISFQVKNIQQNKFIINRLRIGFFIVTTAFVVYESIFSLSFNPLFFFLSMLKFIVAFSTILFLGYIVIGDTNYLSRIQDKSIRKKEVIARILHLMKDVTIMILILSAIYGILYATGLPKYIEANFLAENPTLEFPLRYKPSNIELILIISIIIIQLLSLFNLNYWIYTRGTQYTGYNNEKKILKLKISRAIIGYVINAIIFGILLTFIMDDFFVATKFPDIMASWDKFDAIFTSNAYILLVIELVMILILNLYYIVDGYLANKLRMNFVKIDVIES